MTRLAAVAACAALLAGCGHVESHHVAFRPLGAARAGTELHIGVLPSRPFDEVGLVQSVGYGSSSDEGVVLGALRREGQQRGCDAVVKVRVDRGSAATHALGVCAVWR